VLLSGAVALLMLRVVTCMEERALYQRIHDHRGTVGIVEVNAVVHRQNTLYVAGLLLAAATCIAFAVWTWRVYTNLEILGCECEENRSSGFLWLVPMVNLMSVAIVVNDIIDAGNTASRSPDHSLRRWSKAWSFALLGFLLTSWIGSSIGGDRPTYDDLLEASGFLLAQNVVLASAAVLAIVTVRGIARQQRDLFR